MSPRPMNYQEAGRVGLLVAKDGVRLFSNGTEYECWASENCHECAWWAPDGPAGEYCAMEAAMMIGTASSALVHLFGLARKMQAMSDGIAQPVTPDCRFFKQVDDYDGPEDWPTPPPPPDPNQLVLIADPTEVFAGIAPAESPTPVGAA